MKSYFMRRTLSLYSALQAYPAKIVLLVVLSVMSLCITGARAEGWHPEDIPMVHLQDGRRYVSNPDNILAASTVSHADSLLGAMEREHGVQSVVIVCRRIAGNDPYDFCMKVARKYGVGSKEQNSGLIVLLATDDRACQILTGSGLEGTLPDALCNRIQKKVMMNDLKAGNWDAAITKGLEAIHHIVSGDESLKAAIEGEEDGTAAIIAMLVVVILFGGIAFIAVLVDAHQKTCPACKKAQMKVVKKQRVKVGQSIWAIRSTLRCPRCGHTKTSLTEENSYLGGGNATGPIVTGSMLNHGSRGGSTLAPGSFGGGFFGGGGSTFRF